MGWTLNTSPSFLGMSGIATINDTGLTINDPVAPKLEALLINATISALGLTNATTQTSVKVQHWDTFYSYANPARLLAAYGVPLLLTIVATILGFKAMVSNRVSADHGFFQILLTTRNPELDDLSKGGSSGGAENVPNGLKNAHLKFGITPDGRHAFMNTAQAVQ
jgi:hypothetical protein